MANQVLYGFESLQSLADRRVTEVGVQVVTNAIDQALEEHNRQMNAVMSLFIRRTTDFKTRFRTPTLARLQGLDENGRARPIQPAGQYDVAFPLQYAGAAFGETFISRNLITVQEAQERVNTLLTADRRWMRDHILAALFVDGNWTFTDPQHGSLTVYGPASGDSTVYQIMTGADAGGIDDHVLAQANAIDSSNDPFPTIYQELTEHPENGGEVVVFVPTNLKASVEALTNFYPVGDPNLRSGSGVTELVGTLGTPIPGELLGYYERCWIVEWRSMPSSYLLAVTTEGERPLSMREFAVPELQGFRRVADRDDHPFYEQQWQRFAGFGAWNRVGALVMRIGNGTYAVPTGYDSPMA